MSTSINRIKVEGCVLRRSDLMHENGSPSLTLPQAPNNMVVMNAPNDCVHNSNARRCKELKAIMRQESPSANYNSRATPIARKMDFLTKIKDSKFGLSSMDENSDRHCMPKITFQVTGHKIQSHTAPESLESDQLPDTLDARLYSMKRKNVVSNSKSKELNNTKVDGQTRDALILPSLCFGNIGSNRFSFPGLDAMELNGRRLFSPMRLASPPYDFDIYDFIDTSEYMFPLRRTKRAGSSIKSFQQVNMHDLGQCLTIESKKPKNNRRLDDNDIHQQPQFMQGPNSLNNPYRNLKSQERKRKPKYEFSSIDSYLSFNKALQRNSTPSKLETPVTHSVEGQAFADTLFLRMMFALSRPATHDTTPPAKPATKSTSRYGVVKVHKVNPVLDHEPTNKARRNIIKENT